MAKFSFLLSVLVAAVMALSATAFAPAAMRKFFFNF
jgi:hypothetical protein